MEDLKSSCLVSRGFYELITTNPKIIKRLFLKVTFTQDNQEEELEAITNTHRVFHNMKIQSLVYHDVPSFRSKEHNRKVLAKFGKSIKEIIIIGIGMFPVSAVIAFFPNIVSATIENCIDPEQENEQLYSYTLTNTLLPFDKLKSLCLDNCAVSGFSHATKLESFTVIRCKTLEFDVYVRHHRFNNDNFIETLKNSQATLKNLKVEEFHFSYRDGCQPQLSLTKLSLSKPNIFDVFGENLSQAQFIIDFLRTQNKLQYLRLGLSAVTNEYIIEPIAKMHELKSLELVVNREYKHIKFESINRSVENLKIEYEPDNSFEGYFGVSIY